MCVICVARVCARIPPVPFPPVKKRPIDLGGGVSETPCFTVLDGPNRQSPIASVQRTRSTLAGHSAGPLGTNTTPTNANRAIRIAAQRTQATITHLRGENWEHSGWEAVRTSLVPLNSGHFS